MLLAPLVRHAAAAAGRRRRVLAVPRPALRRRCRPRSGRAPSASPTSSPACCRTGTTPSSPTCAPARTVLVAAHGNSLRALDQAPRRDERGRRRRAQRADRASRCATTSTTTCDRCTIGGAYLDPGRRRGGHRGGQEPGQALTGDAALTRWSRGVTRTAYSPRHGQQEGIRRPPQSVPLFAALHPQGARADRPIGRRDQDDRGHACSSTRARPGARRSSSSTARSPSSATAARSPRSARAPSSASCRCSTTARARPRVVCETDCTLFVISQRHFLAVLDERPDARPQAARRARRPHPRARPRRTTADRVRRDRARSVPTPDSHDRSAGIGRDAAAH